MAENFERNQLQWYSIGIDAGQESRTRSAKKLEFKSETDENETREPIFQTSTPRITNRNFRMGMNGGRNARKRKRELVGSLDTLTPIKGSYSATILNEPEDNMKCTLGSPGMNMLLHDESLINAIDLELVAETYIDKHINQENIEAIHQERKSPDMFVNISGLSECDMQESCKEQENCNSFTNDFRNLFDDNLNFNSQSLLQQECDSVRNSSHKTVSSKQKSDMGTEVLTANENENELRSSNLDATNNCSVENAINEGKCTLTATNLPLGKKIRQALVTNAVRKPTSTKKQENPHHFTSNVEQNLNHASSDFFDLGPFFNLPTKIKHLIEKHKGINKLYAWQEECLNLKAVKERQNLIYTLPTSGGKTLVAEILVLRELLCRRKNAIFVLPFISIVQEKVQGLAPFGIDLDFFVEEYAAGKGQYPPKKRRRKQSVYIATIEKALGLINSLIESKRLEEVGLVVIDELHLLGENSRGATLEGLLTKLLYINESIHLVGMTATVGNLQEIAEFLHAEIYTCNFRPVELKEYVKCNDELYSINWNVDSPDDLFILQRKLNFQYTPEMHVGDPDNLMGLVTEVIPEQSCLVFCPTKKNCENVVQLICKFLPKTLLDFKREEKEALYRALTGVGNGSVCPVLKKSLAYGMAYHHSGLMAEEKTLLQDAYLNGTLCCLCCTSTLAAGVNLPAKRVIIRAPYIGRDFINLSRYKQMVGRAGRAGFNGLEGESILMCSSKDAKKVGNLIRSAMDEAMSSLHLNEARGLRNLILSAVALGIATTRAALQKLCKHTLLSVQAKRLEVGVNKLIDEVLADFFKLRALKCVNTSKSSFDSSSQSVLTVQLDGSFNASQSRSGNVKTYRIGVATEITVNRLGKAAIKGCVDLKLAHMLYKDLVQAQKSLVVASHLHLLYLVTPYDLVYDTKPNTSVYFIKFGKLDKHDTQTASILGITEACMVKLVNGQKIKVEDQVMRRFYLTLMLNDLWHQKSVWEVAQDYQVPRGFVQNLMTSSASFASSVLHFCEELEEFWAFKDLMGNFSQRLSHCCTAELLPLMELPAVKRGRAKQLYKAGFKTLHDIATADPQMLVKSIDIMPKKVANQIVAAAKLLLVEKAESLREEAEDVLEGVVAPSGSR